MAYITTTKEQRIQGSKGLLKDSRVWIRDRINIKNGGRDKKLDFWRFNVLSEM
jgi:hypothetical protein